MLQLKHLILSHHGTYEFGSPKLPMTPEAIALHHLDNLDAKIHNFSHMISDDLNPKSAGQPMIPTSAAGFTRAPANARRMMSHCLPKQPPRRNLDE